MIEGSRTLIDKTGIPESPVTYLHIENALVTAKKALKDSDGIGVTIRNVELNVTEPGMKVLDVRDLLFENVVFKSSSEKYRLETDGETWRNIRFENCPPPEPEGWSTTRKLTK